jgi:hypothetical protein
MLRLTDAFIWEDLPRTDPETGSVAMAAWIPRFQRILFFLTYAGGSFHVIQSSIRLLTSEDRPMLYETWYPFDATKSPAYELINVAQVIICIASVFYIARRKINFTSEGDNMINDVFLSECFSMSLRNHVFY